jgi:branched-chain amino acid transport system permease protein
MDNKNMLKTKHNVDLKGSRYKKWITYALLLIAVCVIPLLVKKVTLMNMFILILLGGYMGMCWNLMSGLTGCFSMGHAVFFGLGAYTVAVLYGDLGISPLIGMFAGGIVAALGGFVMGLASLRLKHHFFGLATLAFAEICASYFVATKVLFGLKINGAQGYMIPAENSFAALQFEEKSGYYYLLLIMVLILLAITIIIMNSRLGYFGKSIKDDQGAAEAVGVKTTQTKIIIATISAFLTAFAGGFYVVFMRYIEPSIVFDFGISVDMICYTVMGGVGTVFGPLLGAALLVPLKEIVRSTLGSSWQGLHIIIYGVITIIVLILLPEGIIGGIKQLYKKLKKTLGRKKRAALITKSEGEINHGR